MNDGCGLYTFGRYGVCSGVVDGIVLVDHVMRSTTATTTGSVIREHEPICDGLKLAIFDSQSVLWSALDWSRILYYVVRACRGCCQT